MATRNHISPIVYKGRRFLITDRPTDDTVPDYVKILKDHHVTQLARVCEPSYNTKPLQEAGIEVHDWPFVDGDPPPEDIINKWLALCKETFAKPEAYIAVHCVAGLGRAPVLVALCLIEAGMSSEDAVIFVREKRHGAINRKQLMFLQQYKRRNKDKGCIVM